MKKLIDIATLIAAMGMTLTLCACSNNSDSGSTPTPPAQEKYVIKVAQGVTGGTVTASAEQADAGTAITLTAKPNIGYIFNKYAVCAADGTAIKVQDNKFEMPQKNVIVAAFFTAKDYTVTFNANNGSETPATATRTFKAGESKDLPEPVELGGGFEKKVEGKTYYFVGWSKSPDTKIEDCEYGGGALYTGNQDITFYAVWIKDPVNDIKISPSENGKVSSNASAATKDCEITLTITPETGYKLDTLKVTAEGDEPVEVSGTGNTRTFIMPDKKVTVSATFIVDEFTIATKPYQNGVIMTSKTAKYGEEVWLILLPHEGYKAEEPVITAADGTKISPYNSSGIWKFKMPGQNVTISANFVPAN